MLYSPLEAGIGPKVNDWHCRRSPILNTIGGAITRMRVSTWRVIVALVRAVFRVKNAVGKKSDLLVSQTTFS